MGVKYVTNEQGVSRSRTYSSKCKIYSSKWKQQFFPKLGTGLQSDGDLDLRQKGNPIYKTKLMQQFKNSLTLTRYCQHCTFPLLIGPSGSSGVANFDGNQEYHIFVTAKSAKLLEVAVGGRLLTIWFQLQHNTKFVVPGDS